MKLLAAAALLLLVASCGGEGPLSIEEARDQDGSVVEVEGYLIERGGELRLCEAILESFPPQCGEPSLRVDGSAPGPSEKRVTLLGKVEDGAINIVGRA